MIKSVIYFNDNRVLYHTGDIGHVGTKFEPGYYRCYENDRNVAIEKLKFTEVHEPFPNQKSIELIDYVTKFTDQNNRKMMNELGHVYKFNCLMYGAQGVGKTAIMTFIAKTLIGTQGAIVFRIDNDQSLEMCWSIAEEVRKIQDNLIVFVADEFDLYSSKPPMEAMIKNKLDGNRSIDNSIVLAATNYLDRIPATLKDRPSRFRLVQEILPLDSEDLIKSQFRRIISKSEDAQKFFTEELIEGFAKDMVPCTIDQIKTKISDIIMNVSLEIDQGKSIGFNRKSEDEVDTTQKDMDNALIEFIGSVYDIDVPDEKIGHGGWVTANPTKYEIDPGLGEKLDSNI